MHLMHARARAHAQFGLVSAVSLGLPGLAWVGLFGAGLVRWLALPARRKTRRYSLWTPAPPQLVPEHHLERHSHAFIT